MVTSSIEICLDLSIPLHIRLSTLYSLDQNDVDNVLECICSMYNIHPTTYALQYLQALILHDRPCIRRRIRIAEMCDLGRTVLFLISRISEAQDRISYIEMFSNPYLKFHAYCAAFAQTSLACTRIQIVKNVFPLFKTWKIDFFEWFGSLLNVSTLPYIHRANCADFILTHDKLNELRRAQARQFLGLGTISTMTNMKEIYRHRENVHLFVPKPHLIEKLFGEKDDDETKRSSSVSIKEIHAFYLERHLPWKTVQERIINDSSRLGTLKYQFTLTDLLCRVWGRLTDDLRILLAEDIESSTIMEHEWVCTTGYYNRIINIFQTFEDDSILVMVDRREFVSIFFERMNHYLSKIQNKDEIALEMISQNSEHDRTRYLSFKIRYLSIIIDDMQKTFPQISQQEFDNFFSDALKEFEDATFSVAAS